VVGSGTVYHVSRDRHVGTVPSYCTMGYPYSRVPTVAPGPTSGGLEACRWGQSQIGDLRAIFGHLLT
jgi:hypothetical protein